MTIAPVITALRCRLAAAVKSSATACGRWLTWLVEHALAARPLMLAFLAFSAVLAATGWLRPPMGYQLSALRIPIFPTADAAHLLTPPEGGIEPFRIDTVGVVLLLVIAGGSIAVLLKPKRFSTVCGLLLCTALAGGAAACWNHPALVEAMEFELEESSRIRKGFTDQYDSTLSQRALFAKSIQRRTDGEHRSDVWVGMKYLQSAMWLVVLAGAGVVWGTPGHWLQRLTHLTVWMVLGVIVAEFLCLERLRGEFLWQQACRQERRGEFDNARRSAEKAVAVFPPFQDLHRTWYLFGKLDEHTGRMSPHRHFFQMTGLAESNIHSPALHQLLDNFGTTPGTPVDPLTRLASRVLVDAGLHDFQQQRYAAAEAKWRQSLTVMPNRFDSRLLLALSHASAERRRPDDTFEVVKPLLVRIGDRALKAEIWSTLGDVHFESGEFQVARDCYAHSLKEFHLPKVINHRAIKGLIGI